MTRYAASADTRKGLQLDVMVSRKWGTACAGGLSETFNEVTVVEVRYADGRVEDMPRCARVFAATPEKPACALVQRHIGQVIWHVEPITDDQRRWFMFGGSFVHTTDSRLSEITKLYGALSFHDRWESDR